MTIESINLILIYIRYIFSYWCLSLLYMLDLIKRQKIHCVNIFPIYSPYSWYFSFVIRYSKFLFMSRKYYYLLICFSNVWDIIFVRCNYFLKYTFIYIDMGPCTHLLTRFFFKLCECNICSLLTNTWEKISNSIWCLINMKLIYLYIFLKVVWCFVDYANRF